MDGQARTQPFSKGGSIGGVPPSQTMSAFMLWALTQLGGSGGMLPQKFLELLIDCDSETVLIVIITL